MIEAGTRLGNYILQAPVGKGAFAEVWRGCHHDMVGNQVAVKIALESSFRKQLARERGLPRVGHPRVVPILDSDLGADPPYVVMPFLAGGSLASTLVDHPRGLPESRVAVILEDILSGLAAAHAKGLIHRDIKPQNILLDGEGRASVSDFGLSLDLSSKEGGAVSNSLSVEQRSDFTIAGTLAYMAPEVMEGLRPTPSSDVHSVGWVLFEMLVGRRPLGMEKPSDARSDLQRAVLWDSLFYWAVAAGDRRYPSAREMLLALKEGPKPAPIAVAVAVVPFAVPKPVQATGDKWQDLAVRLEEYETLEDNVDKFRQGELLPSLRIYAERHPTIVGLRQKESSLQIALSNAGTAIGNLAHELVVIQQERIEITRAKGASLLQEGCLPNHPDVLEMSSRISCMEALHKWLKKLESEPYSGPLPERAREWRKAKEDNEAYGIPYDKYLDSCFFLKGDREVRFEWVSHEKGRDIFLLWRSVTTSIEDPWAQIALNAWRSFFNRESIEAKGAVPSTSGKESYKIGIERRKQWLMAQGMDECKANPIAAIGTPDQDFFQDIIDIWLAVFGRPGEGSWAPVKNGCGCFSVICLMSAILGSGIIAAVLFFVS